MTVLGSLAFKFPHKKQNKLKKEIQVTLPTPIIQMVKKKAVGRPRQVGDSESRTWLGIGAHPFLIKPTNLSCFNNSIHVTTFY